MQNIKPRRTSPSTYEISSFRFQFRFPKEGLRMLYESKVFYKMSTADLEKQLDTAWKEVRASGNDAHKIADAMKLDAFLKKRKISDSENDATEAGKARDDKIDTVKRLVKDYALNAPPEKRAQAEHLRELLTELLV